MGTSMSASLHVVGCLVERLAEAEPHEPQALHVAPPRDKH